LKENIQNNTDEIDKLTSEKKNLEQQLNELNLNLGAAHDKNLN